MLHLDCTLTVRSTVGLYRIVGLKVGEEAQEGRTWDYLPSSCGGLIAKANEPDPVILSAYRAYRDYQAAILHRQQEPIHHAW